MAKVIELTPDLCKTVTQQKGVVLLYFRADWCGACKTMGRIIDQIVEETPDKLLIAKFRLKLKKVQKTIRPFSYDLN